MFGFKTYNSSYTVHKFLANMKSTIITIVQNLAIWTTLNINDAMVIVCVDVKSYNIIGRQELKGRQLWGYH